jgi:DNA-binding CsgD family transcriptional regulator/tetratricopeptide (TPR) repeat protein
MIEGMAVRTVSAEIIAREPELATLAEALDVVAREAGEPAVHLVVSGEAGIGKTRLVEELRRMAEDRGCLVLWGSATDLGDGDVPYGALVEALRRLPSVLDPDDLATAVGPATKDLARLVPALGPSVALSDAESIGVGSTQSRILEALLGTLQRLAERGPVVVIVEDLHWADPATRDALAFLIRNLRDERVLLVLTVRSDDLFRRHPLVPWLAEVARSGRTRRVDLSRLDPTSTARLVAAMTRAAPDRSAAFSPVALQAIHDRSDGNPFFVEELVMATGSDGPDPSDGRLPPTLQDVLTARLAAVPPAAQTVMGVIAVAGRMMDHDLLVAVAGVPDDRLSDGLRAAIERQLLVVDAGPDGREHYAFRHALLQEAAYDILLPAERRQLHRRMAEALAARPIGTGADAAAHWSTLAAHWSAAHEVGPAFEASVRAGSAAADTFAFAEARRQFERAIDGWGAVDDPGLVAGMDREALLTRAAQAAWLMGDARQAVAWRREAAEAIDPAVDPVRASVLLAQLSQALWHHGLTEEAIPISERAVATMPSDARTPQRARVLAGHAKLLMLTDRLEESIRVADAAIELAVATGARPVEGHARATKALCLSGTWRCAESEAESSIALAIALETRDPDDLGRCHINRAEGFIRCGRPELGLDVLEAGLVAVTEAGASSTYGRFVRADAVLTSVEVGRWADARRYMDDPFVYEFTSPQTRRYELGRHVALLVGTGDATATAALDELWELLRDTPVESQFHGPYWVARIEHDLWVGDPTAALQAADAGLAQLAGGEWRWAALRLIRLGVRAAADLAVLERARRRPDGAAAAASRAAELAAGLPGLVAAWPSDGPARREADAEVTTVQAEVARAEDRDAAASWWSVAATWSSIGRPPLAAYAGWRAAEAAAAGGDRILAQTSLDDAYRIASQLGATPLIHACRSLATRSRLALGAETSPTLDEVDEVADDPFGLTERERTVLTLVARGYTNRQIGTELFISESTAGVHVSNILGKLGVTGRTEAAAIAVRLGLDQPAGDRP